MRRMKFLRADGGFTLIEALIATVVVAFGMMAVVGMQITLSRGGDLARQRSEAARMAEQRIEQIRSFSSIETKAGHLAWNDLANGTDTMQVGPTTFTRETRYTGATTSQFRNLTVAVSWTDRTGASQTHTLNTVVSRTNPEDSGSLGFPLPGNSTLKRPMNRNLNIPVPATDLGNGQSVMQLQSFAVVFDNDSGYVVMKCTVKIQSQADLEKAIADGTCNKYNAYILAGYISKNSGNWPTSPIGISTAGLTGVVTTTGAVACDINTAVDQTTGKDLADYKYYLCVVSVPEKGAKYSGTIRLTGFTAGPGYLVCRFMYPKVAGQSDNQRNKQPYADVGESLDSQNYIITTGNSCPTVNQITTTEHQICTSSNTNRAADCPAI